MDKSARPRILAIDDTPLNLMLLLESLKAQYEIEVFERASLALDRLHQVEFDLILLDVMMPVMDGFAAFREIRKLPNGAQTPIIFLTAVNDHESEKTGLSLGAADFIFKPVRLELVRLRIGNVIRMGQLARDLRASEERLRHVMDATGDGIWDWYVQADRVVHNRAWCAMLGLDEARLEHPLSFFADLIHPEDFPVVQERLYRCLHGEAGYFSEHRLRHADGHYRWVEDRGQVAERDGQGQPLRMLGSIKDITRRKQDEAEIEHLAFFDTLTELPNRRLFLDRLQQAMRKLPRDRQHGALLFIDMDRFKELNDTHGHAMGDALLIQVASRLRATLRQRDTVARLGGDEFVILVEGLAEDPNTALEQASLVGRKVLDALNVPYALGNIRYPSTPSIGLTLFDQNSQTVDEVIGRADRAMYAAKRAGRNMLRYELALADVGRSGASTA